MLTWKFLTKSIYDNLPDSEKSFDKLFYLKDTKEIFCGLSRFMESIVIYKNNPTTHISGKVYINADTLEGKIWSNSKWINVINPVKIIPNGIADSSSTIKNISYSPDSNNNTIYIYMNDNSINTINLQNFVLEITYINDEDNICIHIDNVYGIISETNKTINLYNFIECNLNDNNTLSILFDDIMINFSIEEILNNYNNTSYIPITITGNSFIAESILYSNESNICIFVEDNLYITTNANKVNEVSLFSVDIDSNNKLYTSEELSDDAINQIRASLESTIGDKMLKVGEGYTGEILIADIEGNAYPSGVKIGKSVINDTNYNNLVATEKAIVEYIDNNTMSKNRISTSDQVPKSIDEASDAKIASEKALVKAMSWNII